MAVKNRRSFYSQEDPIKNNTNDSYEKKRDV
jgi:hypothetical protein